jgi:hypothetical protein
MEGFAIDPRFNGPPDSGNGGYTCGCVARALGAGPAQVSLRMPPPLGKPLTVEVGADGARLLDGEAVVAEGARVEPGQAGDVPAAVSVDDARAATERSFFRAIDTHPFPTCFVCGPERAAGDGLRIFAGWIEERELFAADWSPPESLAREDGTVADEIVWAALDCPTSAPGMNAPGPDGTVLPIVLARLAVEVSEPVAAGADHVLTSWEIGRDGRKREAGSALFDAGGTLLASARALWIELRPAG